MKQNFQKYFSPMLSIVYNIIFSIAPCIVMYCHVVLSCIVISIVTVAPPAAVADALAGSASLQCLHHYQHIPRSPVAFTIREWMPSPVRAGHFTAGAPSAPAARACARAPTDGAPAARAAAVAAAQASRPSRECPVYKVVNIHCDSLRRRRRRANLLLSQRPRAAVMEQQMILSVQQKEVSHHFHESTQKHKTWN
jgi:hypothetical protein